MQASYFHFCPIRLEPGSIIKPGNFGRNINGYLSDGLNMMTFREMAFEITRLRMYPDCPSRLNSVFLFHNVEIAESNRHKLGCSVLYEVKLVDAKKLMLHADMGLIDNTPTPSQNQPAIPFMMEYAELYWQGKKSIDCNSEILTESSVQIIRQVDLDLLL